MVSDLQRAADELSMLQELQRQMSSCTPPGNHAAAAPPVHRLRHPPPQAMGGGANLIGASSVSSFRPAIEQPAAPHAKRVDDPMAADDDDGGVAARTAALGASCCPNPSAVEQASEEWLVKQKCEELLARPGVVESAVAAGCKSAANAERLAANSERQTVGMCSTLPDGILSNIFRPVALGGAGGRPPSEIDDQPCDRPLPPPLPPLPIDGMPSYDSLTASHLAQMRKGVWDPMTSSSVVRYPPITRSSPVRGLLSAASSLQLPLCTLSSPTCRRPSPHPTAARRPTTQRLARPAPCHHLHPTHPPIPPSQPPLPPRSRSLTTRSLPRSPSLLAPSPAPLLAELFPLVALGRRLFPLV